MPTHAATYTPSPACLSDVANLIGFATSDGVSIPQGVTRFDTLDVARRASALLTNGCCLIDWSPGDMTRYVLTVMDLRTNVLGGRYAVAYLSNQKAITIGLDTLGDYYAVRQYLTDNVASAYVLAIYFTMLADALKVLDS